MYKFDDSEFLRCTWPCCKGIIADAKVDAFGTPGAQFALSLPRERANYDDNDL